MSRLPAWLRHLAALAVVTFLVVVLVPAAFLVEHAHNLAAGSRDFANWFRPWCWRERHKRLNVFVDELRSYVDRLDRRWEAKR